MIKSKYESIDELIDALLFRSALIDASYASLESKIILVEGVIKGFIRAIICFPAFVFLFVVWIKGFGIMYKIVPITIIAAAELIIMVIGSLKKYAQNEELRMLGEVKQNMLNAEVAKLTMLKDIDTWQLKKIIEDIAPMIGLKVTDIKSTKES